VNLPTYAQLQSRSDGPAGTSWGVFGADDQVGSINLLTPQRILAGIGCVRRGAYFNLDYPINAIDPPLSRRRELARHEIYSLRANQRDDYLDALYLQGGTQIDGLRHRLDPRLGFYNGVRDEEISADTDRLGIAHWSEHGIAGRGVLIDVESWSRTAGRPLDHRTGERIPVGTLDAVLDSQGVALQPGDIVMIRTGWTPYFLQLPDEIRRKAAGAVRSTGLDQTDELLPWIWDHRIAMLAADNVALEATPANPASPFAPDGDFGLAHQQLIAHLGLAIGELWRLDELAADCESDGVYECFVAAKPLGLKGGVGSPANAFALK
jgi:kynurenine formamidase